MIGIIGGSGLDSFDQLEISETKNLTTPWGEPSGPLSIGLLDNVQVVFLARHGEQHQLPPHRVNYRANIAALRDIGVSAIIAVNAVGGVDPNIQAGDLVIPDQLVDYTWGREHTFYDGKGSSLDHIDFTYPFTEALRLTLLSQAQTINSEKITVHPSATCAVTQGPRLETAAEIKKMAADGCHIVGMTSMPEAALAREAGLGYASIGLVVNAAAGVSEQLITLEDIVDIMNQRIPLVKELLAKTVAALSDAQ